MSGAAFVWGVPVLLALCAACAGAPPKEPRAPALRHAQHENPKRTEDPIAPTQLPLDAAPFHNAPPPAYGNKVVLAEAEDKDLIL